MKDPILRDACQLLLSRRYPRHPISVEDLYLRNKGLGGIMDPIDITSLDHHYIETSCASSV
jgi:hypothetical protein